MGRSNGVCILLFLCFIKFTQGAFEDSRCRCVCPNTRYFAGVNSTDNHRRYYTKTNVLSLSCNPLNVVKQSVDGVVDDTHLDAFLANCDCKYETRNSVLLKVVVIFVICLVALLCSYMLFLTILDPKFTRRRASVSYKRQEDENDDNIFAQSQTSTAENATTNAQSPIPMRATPRSSAQNVLEKVEEKQDQWQIDVENQRQKVVSDHSILN